MRQVYLVFSNRSKMICKWVESKNYYCKSWEALNVPDMDFFLRKYRSEEEDGNPYIEVHLWCIDPPMM